MYGSPLVQVTAACEWQTYATPLGTNAGVVNNACPEVDLTRLTQTCGQSQAGEPRAETTQHVTTYDGLYIGSCAMMHCKDS